LRGGILLRISHRFVHRPPQSLAPKALYVRVRV
jgi:hypothetical protein